MRATLAIGVTPLMTTISWLVRKSRRSGGSGSLAEPHLIAESLEPSNEAACDALLGQAVEVGVAEILVPDVTRQHAIRADDDLVRNGDPCSTGPTARSQSMVLVLQIAATPLGRSRRRHIECRLQVDIAPADR